MPAVGTTRAAIAARSMVQTPMVDHAAYVLRNATREMLGTKYRSFESQTGFLRVSLSESTCKFVDIETFDSSL